MQKQDVEIVGDRLNELVGGLLGDHVEKIMESYGKTDESLAIYFRISLKGDDDRVSVSSTLSYASERVKDHSNATIDVRQGILEFPDDEGETE